MRTKNFFFISVGLLLTMLGLFIAGSRSIQSAGAHPLYNLEVRMAPEVQLNSVFMAKDGSVNVAGVSTKSTDGCLPVQVLVDGEREPWWPVFRCLEVTGDGDWSVRVPADRGGNPVDIHVMIGK